MSSRPGRILRWSSLMLTTLTAACSSLTEPLLPPCIVEIALMDPAPCADNHTGTPVVIHAPTSTERPRPNS